MIAISAKLWPKRSLVLRPTRLNLDLAIDPGAENVKRANDHPLPAEKSDIYSSDVIRSLICYSNLCPSKVSFGNESERNVPLLLKWHMLR